MDIRMPVMNGLEATRRIKEGASGADTKIVALTAHALEEERIEILEAGCDDFICKPYRDTEIFAALAKHLHIRFLYTEEDIIAGPAIEEIELDTEQLMKIPSKLIDRLRQALVRLNEEQCLKTIGIISDYDHSLSENLRSMIEELQYKTILETLDKLSKMGRQ